MQDISLGERVKVWVAFSPGGLFKLVRNNERECWERLCELQCDTIDRLKKRGYRVRTAILDMEDE